MIGELFATLTTIRIHAVVGEESAMGLENASPVLIYQGEDKQIDIQLAYETPDGSLDPFDLTGATEIAVNFPKTLANPPGSQMPGGCAPWQAPQGPNAGPVFGVPLTKLFSAQQVAITQAGGGKLRVTLTAADTALLFTGDQIPIEVRVTNQGYLTVIQIPSAIQVVKSLFATS